MGFFQDYYGRLFDGLPGVQLQGRAGGELEYRPCGREDLEMVRERGFTAEQIGKMLADPEGADALELLVGLERLNRFQDPSGFRDEQLRRALEEMAPGREADIPAFRAALAGQEAMRGCFMAYQCARLAYGQYGEAEVGGDVERPVSPEDPENWEDPEFRQELDDGLE